MSLDTYQKPTQPPKQSTPMANFAKTDCETCLNPTSQLKPCPEAQLCITIKILQLQKEILAILKTAPINESKEKVAAADKVDYDALCWEEGVTSTGKVCQRAFAAKNSQNGKLTSAYALLKQKIEVKKQKKQGFFANGYGFWVTAGAEPYIGRVKTEGKQKS